MVKSEHGHHNFSLYETERVGGREGGKRGSWHLTVKHAFLMSILVLHKPTLLQPLHGQTERARERMEEGCGGK